MRKLCIVPILASLLLFLGTAFPLDSIGAGLPGDVDGNNSVGLEEAVYALQTVAGIKTAWQNGNVSTYWPMHFGDSWVYQRAEGGTQTNSVSTAYELVNGVQTIRFNYGGSSYDCYTMDGNGMWLHKTAGTDFEVIFDPPQQNSPYVLLVGEHHIADSQGTGTYMQTPFILEGNFMLTLLGFETITVPAGTFDNCLKYSRSGHKVVKDGMGNVVQVNAYVDVTWSAPGVGVVKQYRKSEDGGVIDLELMYANVDGEFYGQQPN